VNLNAQMRKYDFLIGEWKLKYRVPKSIYSEATTGSGEGTFKRALAGKCVFFDYSCTLRSAPDQTTTAHGVFAWDEKAGIHRYWWFESSGAFLTAICNFIGNDTLLMNWHDTLLTQTFKKADPDKVVLRMENPNPDGGYELVMEVILSRVRGTHRVRRKRHVLHPIL